MCFVMLACSFALSWYNGAKSDTKRTFSGSSSSRFLFEMIRHALFIMRIRPRWPGANNQYRLLKAINRALNIPICSTFLLRKCVKQLDCIWGVEKQRKFMSIFFCGLHFGGCEKRLTKTSILVGIPRSFGRECLPLESLKMYGLLQLKKK